MTAATVVDHVVPHKGDRDSFLYEKIQSLCEHHHNSQKAQIEKKGFHTGIGVDGWPLDPNHPVYKTGGA